MYSRDVLQANFRHFHAVFSNNFAKSSFLELVPPSGKSWSNFEKASGSRVFVLLQKPNYVLIPSVIVKGIKGQVIQKIF